MKKTVVSEEAIAEPPAVALTALLSLEEPLSAAQRGRGRHT